MAVQRNDPYGAFNYKVTINPLSGTQIQGAFAEVSAPETEITFAEYREGTEPVNAPRKLPQGYATSDVTLKRGLIGALDLWSWIDLSRKGDPNARATVVIEHRDEANQNTVAVYTLNAAYPAKWVGPALTAKGASDVAMEELTIKCQDVSYT